MAAGWISNPKYRVSWWLWTELYGFKEVRTSYRTTTLSCEVTPTWKKWKHRHNRRDFSVLLSAGKTLKRLSFLAVTLSDLAQSFLSTVLPILIFSFFSKNTKVIVITFFNILYTGFKSMTQLCYCFSFFAPIFSKGLSFSPPWSVGSHMEGHRFLSDFFLLFHPTTSPDKKTCI